MFTRALTLLLSGLLSVIPTADPFANAVASYLLRYVPGDAGLTTTRGSTARYHSSGGVVMTAAVDTPRDSHYRAGTRELLVEPSSTNRLLWSEAFDNAAWTKSNYQAVTADGVVAPDGNTTAELLVPNTTLSNHLISQTLPALTDSTAQAFSIYAKAGGYNYLLLNTRDKANNLVNSVVNLTDGSVPTLSSGSGHTHTISTQQMANGWWHIKLAMSSTNTGATTPIVQIAARPDSATTQFSGDGTSGVSLWGAQFESNQFWVTSYIPTTTAVVTRSADAVYLTYTAAPQEMTVLFNYRDMGGYSAGGLVKMNIGNGTNPYLELRTSGPSANLGVYLNTSAVTSTSTAGASAGFDAAVEDRIVLGAAGTVTVGTSVNSGAEGVGATSGAIGIPGAWSAQRIYLGSRNGSNNAPLGIRKVVVAASTNTLAQMRAL